MGLGLRIGTGTPPRGVPLTPPPPRRPVIPEVIQPINPAIPVQAQSGAVQPATNPLPQEAMPATYDDQSSQMALAQALTEMGSSTTPVGSALEGLIRVGQGALGGYFGNRAEERQAEQQSEAMAQLMAAMTGGQSANPALAAASSGQAFQAPTGGYSQLIAEAAQRNGVDPSWALALSTNESGGDPTAQNPNASAHGLFQMIDSTWQAYAPEGADRNDPAAQAEAGTRFMADVQRQLTQTLGRPPELWEQASAHFLGPAGAAPMLTLDPATPFRQALVQGSGERGAAMALEANPNLQGLQTVGDFRDLMRGYADRGLSRVGGSPAASQPSQPDGPNMQALIGAMSNPALPPQAQQIAGALLAQAMQGPDIPDGVRLGMMSGLSQDDAARQLWEAQTAGEQFNPVQGAPTGMRFTDPSRTSVVPLEGMPAQQDIEFNDLPSEIQTRVLAGESREDAARAVIEQNRIGDLPTIAQAAIEAGFEPGTSDYRQWIAENYRTQTIRDETSALADLDGTTMESLQGRADTLSGILPYLDRMEVALDRGARTGALGETSLFLRQMLDMAGFEGAGDLAETEVLQAVQSYLGPRMRVSGSGSSSDRDVTIFMNSLPNLTRTPEGNRLVIDYIRRLSERAQQEYRIARRYFHAADGMLPDGYFDEINALGPVFSASERNAMVTAAITQESLSSMTPAQMRDLIRNATDLPPDTIQMIADEIARRGG